MILCRQISEKDEAVLEYLTDITEEELDEEEGECGFRLTFHFAKNPFFPHETLVSWIAFPQHMRTESGVVSHALLDAGSACDVVGMAHKRLMGCVVSPV